MESEQTAHPLPETYRNMRRRGTRFVWIGLLFMLGLVIVTALFPSAPPLDYSKRGIHLLLDDGRGRWDTDVWDEHLDYAVQVVSDGGYVVQLVRHDDLNIDRWQLFMDLVAERNLQPIIRFATTFDHDKNLWTAPQADADGNYRGIAADYAAFIAGLDWHTDEHHVILLNEPNHGDEWGGRPDAPAYARFVIDVATALREADPDIQILNAALDLYAPHTGSQPFNAEDGIYFVDAESFLEGMVAAEPEVLQQIDIWNSHVYPLGPFTEAPWFQEYHFDAMHDADPVHAPPPAGISNRGVNSYEWELWKLSIYGITDLQVMITETGWRHNPAPDFIDEAYTLYPDAETVAMYLDLAMRGNVAGYANVPPEGWTPWLHDERVLAVIPFALDGTQEWAHTNWLHVDGDGNILKPYAMFDLFAGYPR